MKFLLISLFYCCITYHSFSQNLIGLTENDIKSKMSHVRFDGKKFNDVGDPYLLFTHYVNSSGKFIPNSDTGISAHFLYENGMCGMSVSTHPESTLEGYVNKFNNDISLKKVSGFNWQHSLFTINIEKKDENFTITYKYNPQTK